jgi:hypothetical protein
MMQYIRYSLGGVEMAKIYSDASLIEHKGCKIGSYCSIILLSGKKILLHGKSIKREGTIFFDAEKPFGLETLNSIKELERKRNLSRSINFGGLDIYILEGVNVRSGIIENAEIVKFEDKKIRCLIATNGNKTYTEEMIKAMVN